MDCGFTPSARASSAMVARFPSLSRRVMMAASVRETPSAERDGAHLAHQQPHRPGEFHRFVSEAFVSRHATVQRLEVKLAS